jgi:hypothetical protein
MKKIFPAILVVLLPSLVAAQVSSTYFDPSKSVMRSSATVFTVIISTGHFTLVESAATRMVGSDYIMIQSTYGNGPFCCSFESDASAQVTADGGKGCIAARRDPGGTYYSIEFRRWWQNLKAYCLGLDPLPLNQAVRVLQSK